MTPLDSEVSNNHRTHGSPARVSGELVRAMSSLYLSARPSWSREQMIRRLRDKLHDSGVHFHERSLRRHVGGAVVSVPPELEAALSEMLYEDTTYTTADAVAAALEARGLAATRPDPDYVSAGGAVLLTRLWLFLHPEASKRALSMRLSADLAEKGVTVGLDALQSELAGRGQLVRREVVEILLGYLAEDGIHDEEEARARAMACRAEMEAFEHSRELVDGQRFRRLSRLWQLQHTQASTRRLAVVLGERLRERGIRVGLDHLQRLISGKARRIRVEVMQAMEEMMETGPGDLDALLERHGDTERALDLQWVDARPIHELAEEWLRTRPGSTTRQLALRVAETVRTMGYSTSHNTIQPILGGWKQRTRGFVHRAMLRQFEDGGPTPAVGVVAQPSDGGPQPWAHTLPAYETGDPSRFEIRRWGE